MTVEQSEASRLGPAFEACRKDNRAALIGYLPTGYPDVPTSVSGMIALVESGCDIIEVGVPYSDPGMDGPTIAKATEAAAEFDAGAELNVIVAVDLWFRTRLPIGRMALVVLAGTIPAMSFVAERWVTHRVRPMIERQQARRPAGSRAPTQA